ncbi:MAG: hypothetical protein IPK79_04730 [Vampirovibrionales bacterium]|nr:hypothetical protein [Vampirovibrionales bacterium]
MSTTVNRTGFNASFQKRVEKTFGREGHALRAVYANDVFRKGGSMHWFSKLFGSLGEGMRKSLKGPMMITALGLGAIAAWNTVRDTVRGAYEDGPWGALWSGGKELLMNAGSLLIGLAAGGLARNIKGPVGWWLGAASMIAGALGAYKGLDALFAPPNKPNALTQPTRSPALPSVYETNPFLRSPMPDRSLEEYYQMIERGPAAVAMIVPGMSREN